MNKAEKQITDCLALPNYKPMKWQSLARQLRITKKRSLAFREALDALMDSGTVKVSASGRLRLAKKLAKAAAAEKHHTKQSQKQTGKPEAKPPRKPHDKQPAKQPAKQTRKTSENSPAKQSGKASGKNSKLITGIIKRTGKGDGYLIPHERTPELNGEDVFIAARDMQDAHTGDEVAVQLGNRTRSSGHRCGRIDEVLERDSNTFVGTYLEEAGQGFVRVDGNTFAEPVSVGDPGAKGAQPDDKVVVEMLRFPSLHRTGEGVLTNVLGARGEPGVDLLTIIHEFGLPDEFPDNVMEEASEQAERFDETDLTDREDLTKHNIITIDPADARDFDDAISLEQSEDGHWHLGVHIADVAHFVQTGGILDTEAQKRGTSVYLPQKVLPMLPEVISNGLASLQQGKVRYVKSVFIEYTEDGVPVHTRFANSAIKVARRFAYEDVMPIVQAPDQPHKGVTKKVVALLVRMHTLAMILRKRRFAKGSLQMGLPEVRIDFNKDGQVTGAHEAHHDESHEVIEEFMLAANIAVAVHFTDNNIAFLRRTHGDPSEPKLKAFSDFVSALGFELPQYQSRQHLQALLDSVNSTDQSQAVNYAFLRSLKQAEYSPLDMGHFALAVDNYCHFTSPIRRYPDLTIHRQFDELVKQESRKKGSRKPKQLLGVDELTKLGRHCSSTSRRAERAERELKRVKLLEYMSGHIGDELEAVVTGVQSFGLFAQTVGIPAEGLVHVSSLPNDSWFLDTETYSLVGKKAGNHFQLGDRILVSINRVDIDRRELDLKLVKVVKKAQKLTTKKKPKNKKDKGKGNSESKPHGKSKRNQSSKPKSKGKAGGSKQSGGRASRKKAASKKSAAKKKNNRRK